MSKLSECKWCGESFNKKRNSQMYCGTTCSNSAKNKRKTTYFICIGCADWFRPSKGSNRAGLFCNKQCWGEWKRENGKAIRIQSGNRGNAIASVVTKRCKQCDNEFNVKSISTREFCTERCRAKHNFKPVEPHKITCKQCGTVFIDKGKKKCGDCVEENRKEWRRSTKNHRKRARKYGVKYTSINRRDIFNRDGWKCKDCGVRVTLDVHWNDDGYATIDHVYPMSEGGDHVPENVQCMCRKCNTNKSNVVTVLF